METSFFSGLDLGAMQDYSALVVTQRDGLPPHSHYTIRYIHRWPLRTPYPNIVQDVKKMFQRPPLTATTLCIDATGVGRAVVDMVRQEGVEARMIPITITAGMKMTKQGSDLRVPKKDLVGVLQVLMGTRRLTVAPSLEHAKTLVKELTTFRTKINTETGHVQMESWRESDHDDIVLASCLPLWWAERHGGMVPLLRILRFSTSPRKPLMRIVVCSYSQLKEMDIHDHPTLLFLLHSPHEEKEYPHGLTKLQDTTHLSFADIDPDEFQHQWQTPLLPWNLTPDKIIFTREYGKKLWSSIQKKRDPMWQVLVFADNGGDDRRAKAIALAVCDSLQLDRTSTIYFFQQEVHLTREEKPPNKYLYDLVRSSRNLVI